MRDKKRRGRDEKLWFTECTQRQVSHFLVRQKRSQWHRTWPACLKRSDQSGILMRNVFVHLASPRCRPHHTQQQAGRPAQKTHKKQSFEPLGLLIGFRGLCGMTTPPGPKPLKLCSVAQRQITYVEHNRMKCAEHTSYRRTWSVGGSITSGIRQRPPLKFGFSFHCNSSYSLCSWARASLQLLALNACIKTLAGHK